MNSRIEWLDSLRAISSIAVVFFHLSGPDPSNPRVDNSFYFQVISYGWLGVPVFFFISGYCIKMVLDNTKSMAEFLIKRFLRIFPAYYFSLLLTLAAIMARYLYLGANDLAEIPKTLESILATIFLLTAPASSTPVINWVYWSLTYEIFFYVIISFSFLLKQGQRLHFVLFITFLSLVYNYLKEFNFFFLSQWPMFSLGFFTYSLVKKENVVTSIGGIVISFFSLFLNYPYLTEKNPFYYLVAATCVFIFALFNNYFTPNIRVPKLFVKIGLCSYSLYLIHVPLGVYLIKDLRNAILISSPRLRFFIDNLTLLVLLILSYFIYLYIEEPFRKVGKRLMKPS